MKKLLIFISLLFVCVNVHADTKKIDTIEFNSSEWYTNYGYWGSNMFTSGTDIEIYTTLTANNTAVNDTDNTVILDLCAGDGIIVKRTATVGNSCANSCFSQNVSVQNLNRSCVLANNSSGFSYRIFLPVNKWDNRYVTSPNSHVYLQDKITISSKYYNSNFIVYGAYLTDELVAGTNDYSEINSQINALNSNINNTNSKLDDVNSKLNDTNSKLNDTNSKLNDTNKNIKDTNDTLKNDDVDTSTGKGFFDSFTTTDNGGISGIITAPFRFINKATSTCQPVSFSFYDKSITLPCGDTLFWSKESVKPLRDVFNVIIGGGFLYLLLKIIFKNIEKIKDPNKDVVEVLNF